MNVDEAERFTQAIVDLRREQESAQVLEELLGMLPRPRVRRNLHELSTRLIPKHRQQVLDHIARYERRLERWREALDTKGAKP